MFRTMTVVVALAASAVLAGCGTAEAPAGPTTGNITVVGPTAAVPPDAWPDSSSPDRIMIIRHGEKPDGTAPGLDEAGNEDDSSLTAVGWERAHALVGLFDPAEGDPRPGLARPGRSMPPVRPTRARGSGPARPSPRSPTRSASR